MIFISYRRSDTGGHAGRLYDQLHHWFDQDALFYDQTGVDSGDRFPAVIESALNRATVVLVVIGPEWLSEINQRVGQPSVDFVRSEVKLALGREQSGKTIRVIPVLVGGAMMPAAERFHPALQATLTAFCTLHPHEFRGSHADWTHQFVRLRERIACAPGAPAMRFRFPGGVAQPYRDIEHRLSPHFLDPTDRLAQLHQQLAESGSSAVIAPAALYGMGGVGKTQLALKYSRDYRDHYMGVWWFRAETETTLQRDAQAACEVINLPIKQGEQPSTAFKHWLESQALGWLLVFDNAEDVAALRPHLPQGRPHHLIITSRNPAWGGIATPLPLKAWSAEQGAAYLARRLASDDHDQHRQLARDLDGLPLALEQAASYLETTGTTICAYRELLAAVDFEGLILDEGRAATGYELTVLATLSVAFKKLSPSPQGDPP